jgi:hypothetical protein
MILQPDLIKRWSRSKVAMERDAAGLLPAARTYDISSVYHYTSKCMEWSIRNIIDMKGLCVKLPYPVCHFEYIDNPKTKDRIEKYKQYGDNNFKFGAIAAYTEKTNVVIPQGAPVDRVESILESGFGDLALAFFGAVCDKDWKLIDASIYGIIKIPIDGLGQMIGEMSLKLAATDTPDFERNEEHKLFAAYMVQGMVPILYSLSLLTCKNVRTQVRTQPAPRSARDRAMNVPISPDRKFHVLDVPLITKLYETKSTLGPKGKSGLHTVGGHFKTYTEDAPLLGKHVGRWWWGDSVRGSAAKGVIQKEYRAIMPINEYKPRNPKLADAISKALGVK